MSELTDKQILALWRWVWTDNGVSRIKPRQNWKRKLLDAWVRAGEGVAGYSPELQQLRNQFGPDWLDKQSAQSIERMSLRARTEALRLTTERHS
jgi:hypothetical protein